VTILCHPKFVREYRRLPETVKDLAEKKEVIFRDNPFDPRLKTHKLKGPLTGFWAFSINQKYRIIFDFADKGTVRFYSVGDHDIYDV
jgi:addiction module RelE/StbE family toxin